MLFGKKAHLDRYARLLLSAGHGNRLRPLRVGIACADDGRRESGRQVGRKIDFGERRRGTPVPRTATGPSGRVDELSKDAADVIDAAEQDHASLSLTPALSNVAMPL